MDEDIVKTLMEDDVSIEGNKRTNDKERNESAKGASSGVSGENVEDVVGYGHTNIRNVRNVRDVTLSEVEYAVLRCLEDTKSIRVISRITGYPEFVVSKAVERLILKGYVDEDLNVIRSYEPRIRRLKEPTKSKLAIIDVAIAIAFLVLIIAMAYYILT